MYLTCSFSVFLVCVRVFFTNTLDICLLCGPRTKTALKHIKLLVHTFLPPASRKALRSALSEVSPAILKMPSRDWPPSSRTAEDKTRSISGTYRKTRRMQRWATLAAMCLITQVVRRSWVWGGGVWGGGNLRRGAFTPYSKIGYTMSRHLLPRLRRGSTVLE